MQQGNKVMSGGRARWVSLAVIAATLSTPAFAQSAGLTGSQVTAEYNDLAANQQVLVSSAQCVQQMDDLLFGLQLGGAITDMAGLVAEIAGAIDPTGITEAAAITTQTVGFALNVAAFGIESDLNFSGTPECNTDIVGGLTVNQGGIYASGDSAFSGSLGVDGQVSAGSVVAGSVESQTYVSAWNGQIILGTAGYGAPQSGISIGGGAIAGAGHLGPQSQSLHATSIAIGNGSLASSEGSVAYGTYAQSTAYGTTATGYYSNASGYESTGLGAFTNASGNYSTAVGATANASGPQSTALGFSASATGGNATALGVMAGATGTNASALGSGAYASNTNATALGTLAQATGTNASALGSGAYASNTNATALGATAQATGTQSLAVGNGATSSGIGSTAIGASAQASGNQAVALGDGASAGYYSSSAVGTGATATRPNQVVLGVGTSSLTVPGINSFASRSAQQGSLSIVTTDSLGNFSSDGGLLFDGMMRNRQGIALAIAMENPDLTGDDHGGVAFNWGQYNGVSAFSLAGTGVLSDSIFGEEGKGRLAISLAVAVATEEFDRLYQRRAKASVATRLGGQLTW